MRERQTDRETERVYHITILLICHITYSYLYDVKDAIHIDLAFHLISSHHMRSHLISFHLISYSHRHYLLVPATLPHFLLFIGAQ